MNTDKSLISYKKEPNSKESLLTILHPLVKEWFFNKFEDFSLPQKYGVLEIHSRKNILISAPTGATKTLTAFLSILNELVDSATKGILEDKVYSIYISPLKALNYDIQVNLLEPLQEIEKLYGKPLGIRVAVRTGDTSQKEKAEMLKNPPHILITTPESLSIMLTSIKFRSHLSSVEWSVIDEIHSLAENKRGVHLSLAMEDLARLSGHMTRVGLSATISPIEEIAKYLVGPTRSCQIVDVQFLKDIDLKVLSPVDDLINTSYKRTHHELYKLIHEQIQKHKTTLIFTNTRAATERVVHQLKEKFPNKYTDSNIGAHHGSLSKDLRHNLEERLRQGKIKTVVSSTSLELGLDIGHVDLVLLLGSPKSVARALQRIGRAGHKLHAKAKGRIIVQDRDDLVECSVLLKHAKEKKIDRIHIPTNCLDVLAQQIIGYILSERININDLYNLIRQSYCYKDLDRTDFEEIIDYLSGKHASLEDRYIYAKIWHDKDTGELARRGKMTRVIYMTNIGTIPDESAILVKVGDQIVGTLDEGFLERIKKGDVFVLGGSVYQFKYAKGMVAQVSTSVDKPPTVPSWYSQMLPLSFDLANAIAKFRFLVKDKFINKRSKKEILEFIEEYLYVEGNTANAIYEYLRSQHDYIEIPTHKKIILEIFNDEKQTYYIFHSMLGRRVNDCLSRALAFAVSKINRRDVEVGINDNGFYLTSTKQVNVLKALSFLKADKISEVLDAAIDKSEILKRRFRHCASRALMILRNYKGKSKRVGRQQVSSQILINAVKRISNNYPILKEARREVLEDLMDIQNTKKVLQDIQDKKIIVEPRQTNLPSPFAFNLLIQGFSDILKAEDKVEFLKRMHEKIQDSIKNKDKLKLTPKSNAKVEFLMKEELHELARKGITTYKQRQLFRQLSRISGEIDKTSEIAIKVLIQGQDVPKEVLKGIKDNQKKILKTWPKELAWFTIKEAEKRFSYDDFWDEAEDKKIMLIEEEKDNLRKDFLYGAKRVQLEVNIQYDIMETIDNNKREPSDKTMEWINELLGGAVPKFWSDDIVKFLKKVQTRNI